MRQYGLWRTERPAGRVPVSTPSLAPDAPAQTRRRGTLRVSVGVSGNHSQCFQQLSFYTTFGKDNGFPTISIQFKDLSSVRSPLRTPCLFWESFYHLASVLNRSSLQFSLGVNDLLRQVALSAFLSLKIHLLQDTTKLDSESKLGPIIPFHKYSKLIIKPLCTY